ncbi:polysaccharide biosynthesis C-terminal domain-containing protein, partial [bacterium]|nr:polysaccharide biosynthesis C-terminal domain-containing protein [bacterium]
LIGAVWFSRYKGHLGIALASTISQIFQTALLVFFLRELCVRNVFSKSIGKTIIISLISGGSVWFFKKYFIPTDMAVFLKVMVFIGIGMTGFILPAILLKSREFHDLIKLITNSGK